MHSQQSESLMNAPLQVRYCCHNVFAGAGGSIRRSSTGGSNTKGPVDRVRGREAELLGTITNLKAALEKAMACSTPNTRYMQVSEPCTSSWSWPNTHSSSD